MSKFVLSAVLATFGGAMVAGHFGGSERAAFAGDMGKGDIIAVATGEGMQEVTTLVTAIKAAGLVDALKGPGPFTVFAPTNQAFAKLPPGTVENLLKPENRDQLKTILLYHVHAGEAIPAAQVRTMGLSTLNGKKLDIRVTDGNVMVNNARVIKTDVAASNGVIHWVDTVLMP
jgi:uncharacterized surface protein with fasciclin (FAS1) repeats